MMETEYEDGRKLQEFFNSAQEAADAAKDKLEDRKVRSVKITKLIPGKRRRRK